MNGNRVSAGSAFVRLTCVIAACVLGAAAGTGGQAPVGPEQPLPFSHKKHAGDEAIKCAVCHRNADPGERMGFPPTSVCMGCHTDEAADKPAIKTLAALDAERRAIRWVRVYQIPSYVFFSHRAHLAAGSACADCHGQVAERERLYREGDISMAGCIKCHQEKQASTDCTYCHDKLN
ncbi:MAG: cytochrome c3 family protein [Blastocatellales bacterium]|nr:cytochrome c3 family protein [Blastocatellales bacterium]